jgi:GDPmannose 4,6-dehydratase
MTARRALIFGVSGQDGGYLASLLLERGYAVHGTSRDRDIVHLTNLHALKVADRVTLHSASLTDFRSVLQVISEVAPDEIYNLAGQSSVSLSFVEPVETLHGTVIGTVNILESIRFLKREVRFYNAASSESFGNTGDTPADEETPFRPRSPYGVSKAAAFWSTANYRESYGLFACSGILFNHESPLRPARFVTQKVVQGAVDIAQKRAETLTLGNLEVARDWGWAPEYVDAMARILTRDEPEDFVIATGELNTLQDFVAATFDALGLDWTRHVVTEPGLLRPSDIARSVGDPGKARRLLGWQAETRMREVVKRLVEAELARRAGRVS